MITVLLGNYEDNHQLKTNPEARAVAAALPRTPAYSTLIKASDHRQLLKDDEKPLSTRHYRSERISGTTTESKDDPGSDVAQFYQSNTAKSELEVQKQKEDETQVELLQQIGSLGYRTEASGIDTEMRNEAGDARIELQHQDSTAKDKE